MAPIRHSHGLRRPLYKGGDEFRGFLDLHEKTFILNMKPQGAVLPRQTEFFCKSQLLFQLADIFSLLNMRQLLRV
jgi:hypothetical protein